MQFTGQVAEVRRDDPLGPMRLVPQVLPPAGPGEVVLRIEAFGLSSNNLTYAVRGDVLGHWGSFPSDSPGWGRVPAWGVASVVDADPEPASPGTRWAGYLPMASYCRVSARRHGADLRVASAERPNLLPLYRDLVPAPDGWHEQEPVASGRRIAMMPFVFPAALLDHLLRSDDTVQVVMSSATSKTALAVAVVLRDSGVPVIGLTAGVRREAAARAGAYDAVLPYDRLGDLPRTAQTVFLDVAGAADIACAVHDRLGPALRRSIALGRTHQSAPVISPAAGSVVERFNTAQQLADLTADLGADAVAAIVGRARRVLSAWADDHVDAPLVDGLEGLAGAWSRLVGNDYPALTAPVIRPGC